MGAIFKAAPIITIQRDSIKFILTSLFVNIFRSFAWQIINGNYLPYE
jgi:hypothetical protein